MKMWLSKKLTIELLERLDDTLEHTFQTLRFKGVMSGLEE